jgi:alkanesulfonate monooxygenase SsuD/methylene tetrahydromethanopterin reductase-like flavin-dependent oxidoreductase (luciferase family)
MRFGTFVFPVCPDPAKDAQVFQEALEEARVSEELGMDAVWVAEHHFDGNCVYVDPISFAAALTTATKRVQIGSAVIQASLHHPIRLAEQISILDHLSKGRFIAGLGKGSQFNTYEYEAFEIAPDSATARFDETEEILLKAWTGEKVEHRGKYWNFSFPILRPRPYTKPHPLYLRAVSGDDSTLAQARKGRPFLMSGPTDQVAKRVAMFRDAAGKAGHGEDKIARAVAQSWVWKHVYVAPTDREAHEIGMPALDEYVTYRERLGLGSTFMQIFRESMNAGKVPRGFLFGSPAKVIEELAELGRGGIGNIIVRFAIGPMPYEQRLASLKLFMDKVAPALRPIAAEDAALRTIPASA